MSTLPNQIRIAEASCGDADELIKALDALESDKRQQRAARFAKAFPGIERALARKVSQKEIIAELERRDLKLHPARFREMLEAERKLRDEHGERICCETCGALLRSPLEGSNQHSQQSDDTEPTA